jgi:hypothetical protein
VSWPTPTRQDHLRFCEIEGWSVVRSSKGKTGTHHDTYELTLESSDVFRTRISRPPDRTDHGQSLWRHILRDQLKVSEAEFWECLDSDSPPKRGAIEEPAKDSIPTGVVWNLINRVGLSEDEVRGMDKNEAIERLNQYWITGE